MLRTALQSCRQSRSLSEGPDRVNVAVGGVRDAGAAVEDARDALLSPVAGGQLPLPAAGSRSAESSHNEPDER